MEVREVKTVDEETRKRRDEVLLKALSALEKAIEKEPISDLEINTLCTAIQTLDQMF